MNQYIKGRTIKSAWDRKSAMFRIGPGVPPLPMVDKPSIQNFCSKNYVSSTPSKRVHWPTAGVHKLSLYLVAVLF